MSFKNIVIFSVDSLTVFHYDESNCCSYRQLFLLRSNVILRYNRASLSYLNSVVLSHLILLTCCHQKAEDISFMWLQTVCYRNVNFFWFSFSLSFSFTYLHRK